jgi:hypothetical protein
VRWFCGKLLVWQKFRILFVMKIDKFWWMKVLFTSVGDEFLQPLFFTSQSLHPRVVFLIFSVCVCSVILGQGITLHSKKKSGVDNWYLDNFFEEFIFGSWYIYLEQTIYHLCRLINCWFPTLAVEYRLLRTIISYVA